MSLKKKKPGFFSKKKHNLSTENVDVFNGKERSFSVESSSSCEVENISLFRAQTLNEIEKYVKTSDSLENLTLNKVEKDDTGSFRIKKQIQNNQVSTKPQCEHSVAQAKASVMIYNNELKKWEHAGGSQGVSRVHVYFNPSGESYRIVGRKVNDNEVVINCLIVKNLKYNKATATFHQWRDQRQVYGLNFASPEDASCFSEAVLGAIEYLSNPAPEPSPQYNTNDSHAGVPYQKSQEDSYQQQQSVSLVQQITPVIKSQQSAPEPPPAPPVPAIVSSVPPSVPAPPPPKSSVPNVQAPPVAPPTVGGAPPPPPPPPPAFSGPPAPPPPPLPGGGNATGVNTSATGGNNAFADALAGVQLKKRVEASIEERRPTLSNANPMDDMMSALNRKLLARKQKADGDDDITDGSNASAPVKAPIPVTINKSVPVSNNKTVVAPKQTKLPVQTKDPTPVASSVGSVSSLSSDEFKLLKEELLSSIREEINAAKNEIIEAIREELSRLN